MLQARQKLTIYHPHTINRHEHMEYHRLSGFLAREADVIDILPECTVANYRVVRANLCCGKKHWPQREPSLYTNDFSRHFCRGQSSFVLERRVSWVFD